MSWVHYWGNCLANEDKCLSNALKTYTMSYIFKSTFFSEKMSSRSSDSRWTDLRYGFHPYLILFRTIFTTHFSLNNDSSQSLEKYGVHGNTKPTILAMLSLVLYIVTSYILTYISISVILHVNWLTPLLSQTPMICWSTTVWNLLITHLIDTIWFGISINLVICSYQSHRQMFYILTHFTYILVSIAISFYLSSASAATDFFLTAGGFNCHVGPTSLSMLSASLVSVRILYGSTHKSI